MPVQVEYAARLCAISSSHFMSFFKRTTGQSFHSYLNQFRIAKAQVLLTTTDKPLDSINQETGFCNQSYFGMMSEAGGRYPAGLSASVGEGL